MCKRLLRKRSANIEKYKVAKKTAKRAVSEAKGRAYADLYQRLSTKEGEKDICRMARARDRKTRDFNKVKCIKDEREQLLVKEDEIRHRWQEYFDNCSMVRTRTPPFSWMTRLMTLIGALCGGFKNRRSEKP